MVNKMIYNSPLNMIAGRRKFILNLNQFRNTHFRILNTAKIKYKEYMRGQILKYKKKLDRCVVVYTVYKGDKRNFDIGNICSIHQKFFEDALVELGILKDDRFYNIPMCMYCYGGIDTDNPRVTIEVVEINKGFKTKILNIFKDIIERITDGKPKSKNKNS